MYWMRIVFYIENIVDCLGYVAVKMERRIWVNLLQSKRPRLVCARSHCQRLLPVTLTPMTFAS